MFSKLKFLLENYKFEVFLTCIILFILIAWLFNKKGKGTWSRYAINKTESKGRIPKESKGEIECRRVLEKMFKKPFPKVRPNFLKNPITSENSDINLELDCYNDELKIGVEYNGIQHYKYTPFFHKSKESFHNQKYRDYLKRDLCEKNGIRLIEVPYTVKVEDIEGFLVKNLR
jgi:hypothetical protein